MAIIDISFNTVDKSVSCKMDGKDIENLSDISISKYDDKWTFGARMVSQNKDQGYVTVESLYASLNPVELTLEQKISEYLSKRV